MSHVTRMRLARIARFFRPQPSKIPVSVHDILSETSAMNVVEQFNRLYYDSGTAGSLRWRGIEALKNPCDLWMMLELLQRVRPSVLVETGTHYGGSALYFAEMTALLGHPCSIVNCRHQSKVLLFTRVARDHSGGRLLDEFERGRGREGDRAATTRAVARPSHGDARLGPQ